MILYAMETSIEKKVHEIAECVFKAIEEHKLDEIDMGLFSGQTGIIIFCSHYLKLFPNVAKINILNSYIDSYFERLTSGVEKFTYCSGLAGILDGLKYLNKNNLYNVDYSDIENAYARLLRMFALQQISNMNYDYLHGALGVIKYLQNDQTFVNEALVLLEQVAEKDGDMYRWKSYIGIDGTIGYNIALSHGISSIIAVLSQINSPYIDHTIRNRIITKACNYVLSQEINPDQYGCYFPSTSLDNESQNIRRSRVAWCYGDLGVAAALWQAGVLLNNTKWKSKAIEVYTYSSSRRASIDSMIYDAELCHGSASVAMMYEYMYKQTNEYLFCLTRNYWLEQTLSMSYFNDGLAGYKTWQGQDNSWENCFDLLNGITGIGLMLLSVLPCDLASNKWMNSFMLQ